MDYKCKFQVSGKVLEIGEVQEFASGFTKRNIIVEASKDADKYPNPIQLTLKKDDCAKADSLCVGDGVDCEGFVEGRRWERDGNVRHFIDLSVKSIVVTDKAAKPTTAKDWNGLLALGAAYGEDAEAARLKNAEILSAIRSLEIGKAVEVTVDEGSYFFYRCPLEENAYADPTSYWFGGDKSFPSFASVFSSFVYQDLLDQKIGDVAVNAEEKKSDALIHTKRNWEYNIVGMIR